MKEIFIVSSPLQALVVGLIILKEFKDDLSSIYVFYEGEIACYRHPGVQYFQILDTRVLSKRDLHLNMKLIMNVVEKPSRLWVSDIFWPMNNAIYSKMKRLNLLHELNFYDEGLVLYWMERLPLTRITREVIKFVLLTIKMKTEFSFVKRFPFHNNINNGKVYALDPSLLNYKFSNLKKIDVNLNYIRKIDSELDGIRFDDDICAVKEATQPILLVSQPHYRVTGDVEFRSFISELTKYFSSKGHENFFVKLHPSENDEVYNSFYQPLGYRKIFQGCSTPLELKLHNFFEGNLTLVSCNSSVLINARQFGYEGAAASFGLNWIAKAYPFDGNLLYKQKRLFEKCDIDIILSE